MEKDRVVRGWWKGNRRGEKLAVQRSQRCRKILKGTPSPSLALTPGAVFDVAAEGRLSCELITSPQHSPVRWCLTRFLPGVPKTATMLSASRAHTAPPPPTELLSRCVGGGGAAAIRTRTDDHAVTCRLCTPKLHSRSVDAGTLCTASKRRR